jgi:hypothetical protein
LQALGFLSFLIITALSSVVLLLLSLLLTNPLTLGPVGVTVWFLILFIGLACLVALGLNLAKSFLKIQLNPSQRLKASWRQGLLIAGWLTIVLGLSSLRQLALRDVILLGIFLGIIEVFVRLRQS